MLLDNTERIRELIASISNDNTRGYARDIMTTVYVELAKEVSIKYNALEEQIKKNVDQLHLIDIYTGTRPATQSYAASNNDFLYAMDDFLATETSTHEVSDFEYQGTFHIDMPYHQLRTFKQPHLELKQSTKYLKKISELYKIYRDNSIPWRTLYFPYVHQLYDVYLKKGEDFDTIKQTLPLTEPAVPYWNVKTITIEPETVSKPAGDKVFYEQKYIFGNANNMYLPIQTVDSPYAYVAFNETSRSRAENNYSNVTIYSQEKPPYTRTFVEILDKSLATDLEFPLKNCLHNVYTPSFIDQLANKNGRRVVNKGEVIRLLKGYGDEFKLMDDTLDLDMRSALPDTIYTYDMNKQVIPHGHDSPGRQVIVLSVTSNAKNYDRLSFIVSQLQLIYPEYKWLGEII